MAFFKIKSTLLYKYKIIYFYMIDFHYWKASFQTIHYVLQVLYLKIIMVNLLYINHSLKIRNLKINENHD